MKSSPPPLPPSDPMLDAEMQQAQSANIAALTTQAQGDTASLMARYGTRLALAGSTAGAPSSSSTSNNPFAAFTDAARGLSGPMAAWMAPMAAITSIYANRGR